MVELASSNLRDEIDDCSIPACRFDPRHKSVEWLDPAPDVYGRRTTSCEGRTARDEEEDITMSPTTAA
jgi:hypothetical protein